MTTTQRTATVIAERSRLEPGDLETVVRLHGREAAEHGLDATFETEVARGLSDLARAWTHSPDAGRLWLAGPAHDPLGSIAITRARPDLARLRWFLVVPRARGLGLGRRLFDAALSYARARSFATVELGTFADLTIAAAMYRKAGFQVIESAHVKHWGRHLELQTYRLSLL
jgi:GNAT superfamily N-acetyltransferase